LQARLHLRTRAAGALVGGALALFALLLVSSHSSGSRPLTPPPRPLPPAVSAAEMAERSGVRVVRVTTTGAGGLIDVRYEIVNPDAASALHDQKTPPAVVDERSGLVIGQLLMGHMHKGQPKAGITNYLVFMNPGDGIRRGDRVSVVLGPARLEHVRVL
jgi:hypothetical protein